MVSPGSGFQRFKQQVRQTDASPLGQNATELINEVGLAMTLESTVHEIGETTHAHPTLSELLMESALAAEGRAINF